MMSVFGFSPFGYEGALVSVEVDLRRGIPAVDIVGLADGAVKESRERMKAAIKNSGFEFPQERVLISLSPADLYKDAGFDLAVALAVIKANKLDVSSRPDFIVMGELELDGHVRTVRGVYPALQKAVAKGIRYAIVPDSGCQIPVGIKVARVSSLKDAVSAMIHLGEDEYFTGGQLDTESGIKFDDAPLDNLDSIDGHDGLKFAMAVAAAGGHHLLAYGYPGCGKTMLLQRMPELLPKLTDEEVHSVRRIYSIAGMDRMDRTRPFRMPHQTASIEGMCGGGVRCMPGEISLAHNGVLFLDEAGEFRSSVLQMLRVPMESRMITLSRAGRSTMYPADFQLVVAMSPCPCGNLGHKDRVCLCSSKSVEQYWRKFSGPLLDHIAIRLNVAEQNDCAHYTLLDLRGMVARARERQYARQGVLNQKLDPAGMLEHCKLTEDASTFLDKNRVFSPREIVNIKALARTISDMQENDSPIVSLESVKVAVRLHGSIPVDF